MHRKLPHLAFLAFLTAPLTAQIHKVAASEVVTRAVGVYEYTGDIAKPTAARIIPITIFINGHLEDAGIYRSQPMPFALQTGIIYSLEQSGKPIGTVTLDYARNILPSGTFPDIATVGTWLGYGSFAPPEKPKPSTLTASAKTTPIAGESENPDDDRPHFTGKQPGDGNVTPVTTTSTASTPSSPAPADDPDRPHLNKHPASPSTDTTNTPDADDPDRPTLKHRDLPPDEPEKKGKKQKQSDSAVIPMATSLNDDPDRPTLKHGKTSGIATPQELQGLPSDLHQITAVSDASTRDPHIFTRTWETHTEHTAVQAKLATLAQPLIAKYEADNKLTAPALSTRPTTSQKPILHTKGKSTHATTPTPSPVTLNEESVSGFELTYGGLPTFVYTAQSPIAIGGPVYVTLIAQHLPSGELQLSLASVTDAAHLDRTPWMRLVDAIDPDASHRGSLLFELRAQSARQFALYRLITAHAEQQFITGVIQ